MNIKSHRANILAIVPITLVLLSTAAKAEYNINETDQGVWRVHARYVTGLHYLYGESRFGCQALNDGTFNIHEVYKLLDVSEDHHEDHPNIITRERLSSDGINYTMDEKSLYGRPKHETWREAAPKSCQEYYERIVASQHHQFGKDVMGQKIADKYEDSLVVYGFGRLITDHDPSAQKPKVMRQISGQGVGGDLQAGLRMTNLSEQSTSRRLAALSSRLSITNGQAAINRANLKSGDPLGNPMSSQMLANQSLDTGVAGIWLALNHNSPISGAMNGASNHLQIGQDFALSPDIIVGVTASQSGNIPNAIWRYAQQPEWYRNGQHRLWTL